ncbi:MAG: outer membrane beta-barrel protein [Desulfuromusa sp.]|nr:outer membrane beta-barrel protein [Desulfuromusa sp.]
MKKIFAIFLVFALVFGLGVSIAGAEIYYSGNAGIVSAQNSDIDDGSDAGKLSFDDGFAATGALGQTIGSAGRVEVELGYRNNNIDKIKIDGLGVAVSGDVTTLSLMGNTYYDFATGSNLTPFIGAGIGVANIKADMDLIGNEDDTVFAYQIAAGGSLAINKNLSVDLQYRYFGTADPDFDGLEAEYNTHNLMIGLRLTF